VNVRLNSWLDEQSVERLHTVAGDTFSGEMNSVNTVFCMFEPDAPGLSADSFPSHWDIYYGTRPGRRYPACGSPPIRDRAKRLEFTRQRRMEDLGLDDVDPEVIERLVWELENGATGEGVAKIMRGMIERAGIQDTEPSGSPVLPVMPNLAETINFGSTDSRGVLVIVGSEESTANARKQLAILLHEPGIAGRIHAVAMTETEWQTAQFSRQVEAGGFQHGVAFLGSDPYGLTAKLQQELSADGDLETLRKELQHSLAVFRATWAKKDRVTHLKEGLADGVQWSEYVPGKAGVAELVPDETNDHVVEVRGQIERDKRAGEKTPE
tara:strand:- start:8678 stop:9649 length:972 start_codon:yes stop_codon:yes gene_type:complete